MKEEFKREYIKNRDETLENIKENNYSWNKYLNYWSKILDKYSVDNVLNLYSYNPYGRLFLNFDEWNDDGIGRRIKPKSKGIPIILDNHKVYVFDIKQTYGKEYNEWSYRHQVDLETLTYYQDKYKLLHDGDKDITDNFYDLFNNISKEQVNNNYLDIKDEEVEFIANLMTPLLLSKLNFNINKYDNGFKDISTLSNESILKCMQVANKESAILYNDFYKNAVALDNVQSDIRKTIINQLKSIDILKDDERKQYLQDIENKRRHI